VRESLEVPNFPAAAYPVDTGRAAILRTIARRAAYYRLSRQAASCLKRLDTETKGRIVEALRDAQKSPAEASDHLVNRGRERRIRVGNLRILFRI
jgi:hypothetical protein